jgi:hypothetical protein
VAGVVAVLAAGLAGGWAAYRAQAPDAETGDALLPALREAATAMWPELTVGRWTPLLARSPDRLWPQNPTHDYFHHWAGAGATLLVKSPGLTLSALGRTAVHSYRLRTSLSQTPWTGGPGLFLGYRGWDHWGRTGYRCQVFYLKKEENRTVFRIERLLLIVWPDVDGLALTEVTQVGSAEVPRPAERQEYDLDVTVRRGVVAEVRWNGMPLKGLTGAELDRRVERADLAGPYGVYCTRGSCVFHQPAVMLLQETP